MDSVALESSAKGPESTDDLRERKGAECSTRFVNAEEKQKRAALEHESLTTSFNDYKVRWSILEQILEEEDLNGELCCKSYREESKVLNCWRGQLNQHIPEEILNGTVPN